VIFSSVSHDGLAWDAPTVVGGLTLGSSTAAPEGASIDAIPSFDSDGRIYVVWEDFTTPGVSQIKFDSSLDGGLTWGGGHDATVLFGASDFALDDVDRAVLDTLAGVLTANPQLVATIAGYQPFNAADLKEESYVLYIAFLADTPGEEAKQKLLSFATEDDELHVSGREVYWRSRKKFSESEFSGARLEKILGMPATLRNSTTIKRLGSKYP